MSARWRRRVLTIQAIYYAATGLWPLLHMRSFELVTGPKTDDWLVRMVGLLALVIGIALGVAVARNQVRSAEITILAMGSAIAFAGIDLWYGLNGTIAPIYLADAAGEVALLIGLIWTQSRGTTASQDRP